MGGAVFPLCCLTSMVEVMKIMVFSFIRSHAGAATLSAPSSSTGHRWPTPLPETPGYSWGSLGQSLWGHCSFLLGPGAHNVLFVPSKNLFPQSSVSSDSSMVGLMATSSKRAYAIPRSAAPRVPLPAAGHCSPGPPQETLYLGLFGVSGSWSIQGLFVPILSKVRWPLPGRS